MVWYSQGVVYKGLIIPVGTNTKQPNQTPKRNTFSFFCTTTNVQDKKTCTSEKLCTVNVKETIKFFNFQSQDSLNCHVFTFGHFCGLIGHLELLSFF